MKLDAAFLEGELGCSKYLESTGCIDGGTRGRVALVGPRRLGELTLRHTHRSIVVTCFLGDTNEAAPDRARTSELVADERPNHGGRDAALVGTAS